MEWMENSMKHWGIAILAAGLFGCPRMAVGEQFGDFTYYTNETAAFISGYTGLGGDVVIPDTIDGLPVTGFAFSPFAFMDSVVSVTLPTNLISIGSGAFHRCTSLESIRIPDKVTYIGNMAFYECFSLASVTIPEGVTRIERWAFGDCDSLMEISIPSSVSYIGAGAFGSCDRLIAFDVAEGNAEYCDIDGVLFDKAQSTLVQFPGGRSIEYIIPHGVVNIGEAAFYECANLRAVTIPGSVVSPEGAPFVGSPVLMSITVSADNPVFSDVEGVLFNKDRTVLVQYPGGRTGGYSIPDHVISVGDFAFFRCYGLTGVSIPDGVTRIGTGAFSTCTNLTSVIIPHTVADIGSSAFYSCDNLAQMTIPEQVTSIGEAAFSSCENLIRFIVGNSVVSIGNLAFNFCPRLTSMYFLGDLPEFGSSIFSSSDNVTVYYLPNTTGWGETFAGRPAVLWNPVISEPTPGVGETGFSFRITGTENIPIAVEATDDLLAGAWTILETNTLAGGTLEFHDEDAWEDGSRVYRIAAP
jgi:hypothetical protein